MKFKTISILLFVLLAVPFSTHAFSLDAFVKQYVTYLNQRIETLTKENKALKEQLKSCTATTPSTTASEETLQEVAKPSPIVTVTANPASVEYGGNTTVSWKAEGATSCTMNSSPVLLAPTGSQPTGSLSTETSYTVTCTNKDTAVTGSATAIVSVSYSCNGNIPANASMWDKEESIDLTTYSAWSYSASDTSTKCQYTCKMGYKWQCQACVPNTLPTRTCGVSA